MGPVPREPWWSDKIRQNLQRRRGVRLGEAAVVSRQVHLSEGRTPGLVTILTSADAGKVFYGRATPGEVIHVDIFHEVAEVDHRRVAAALLQALGTYWAPGEEGTGRLLLDYFDLVTATGGGRVTGDLTHGRSASLRAAHRNHVHLAGKLPDDHLELLLPLVAAVEAELRAQGVEPRRVERLAHAHWSGGAPLDLSAYTDPDSDSLLSAHRREGAIWPSSWSRASASAGADGGPGLRPGRAAPAGGREAGSEGSGGSGGEALEGPGGSGAAAPGSPMSGVSWPGNAGLVDAWEALKQEEQMQTALEFSRRLGSPEEVRRVLRELARQQGWNSLYGSGSSQAPYLLKELEDSGLVRRDIRGMRLTEKGMELAAFLEAHFREVKLRFRKLIRRVTFPEERAGSRRPGRTTARPSPHVRYGPVRGTAPAEPGTWLTDLAVPETIRAALVRSRLAAAGGAASPDRRTLRLERGDIHVCLRSVEPALHICLLIDASASMAGRRILAAKHLARHLLVSTRDKVAVIAFQEREVRVCVPFTRNYMEVEEGLARLQPLGLTPLADGLVRSVELIRQSRVRRPLLLLITDGIPTVPKWSVDPLADALEAARMVNASRIPFGCIGLQPGRRYLAELARAAGGTLHVVEELDEESLVAIAHRERWKMARR
ncbi:MAG TPA: VWA domain-containing protein [Symbiobacteriaceae bacterium]